MPTVKEEKRLPPLYLSSKSPATIPSVTFAVFILSHWEVRILGKIKTFFLFAYYSFNGVIFCELIKILSIRFNMIGKANLSEAGRINCRAIAFNNEWKDEESEDAAAKSFSDAFFHVFGIHTEGLLHLSTFEEED